MTVDFGEKEITLKPPCQRPLHEENEEFLYHKLVSFHDYTLYFQSSVIVWKNILVIRRGRDQYL